MNMHGSRLLGFLFWVTYFVAALACWLTTYQVFAASDTPLVAGLAAASIDGVLALTLYMMGRTGHSDQKVTALVGTVVFGVFSGFAQIVHRFDGLGMAMPEWMKWVSLFLLPASTTGGLVLLGVLKYFSNSKPGNSQNQGKQRGGGNWAEMPHGMPEPRLQERSSYPAQERPSHSQPVPANGNGRLSEPATRPFQNDAGKMPRLIDPRDEHPTSPA